VRDLAALRRLIDDAAPRYVRDIAPVLAPLAADFAAFAAPRPDDRVLDVGTGTGLVARCLASRVRRVIGIDLAAGMLSAARDLPAVLADLHHAPFPRGAFSLVVASFGLNATRPARSLPALRRLLAAGGRLAIQEWGPQSALDHALDDLLAGVAVDDPPARLAAFRTWAAGDGLGWADQLQDPDDYREWLAELGFAVETAVEEAPVALRVPSAGAYLAYWSAWPGRALEIDALAPAARADLLAAAAQILAAHAGPDGALTWRPVVLRALARLQGVTR